MDNLFATRHPDVLARPASLDGTTSNASMSSCRVLLSITHCSGGHKAAVPVLLAIDDGWKARR